MQATGPITTDQQPKVSVVITAYNREKYIGQAIESVLAQTLTDFELIIVDDCSRDKTAEIAHSYSSDPRVRVYVNERNLRQFPNRNHASTLARGAFLKFHDSDDLLYPHCLEVMAAALEHEPRAAFAVSCFKRWVGGPCPVLSTPTQTYQRDLLGAEGIMWAAPGYILFRTKAFRDLAGFPDAGVMSDGIFLLQACARVNVLLVPADLFWYRVHPGQEICTANASDSAARCAALWQVLTGPGCPLNGAELEQAKRNWCWRVGRYSWEEIIRGRWRAGLTIARGAGISGSEWFYYLRRPRRSDAAGVPIDEKGEYPAPEWLSRSASHREGGHSRAHLPDRSGQSVK
jgi:glycosyltransferase involved in cell wall biosynthesis